MTVLAMKTGTGEAVEAKKRRSDYAIEIAEIGAALGSGDIGLVDEIWAEQPAGLLPEVFECLDELVAGGALVNHDPHLYTEAFSLLCAHLGEVVESKWLHDTSEVELKPSPFDVPESDEGRSIKIVSADEAAGLANLNMPHGKRVIITFS